MRFTIAAGQKYVSPGTIAVEGDASSASYFLGGAAITGGPVTVRGCGRDSVQVNERGGGGAARASDFVSKGSLGTLVERARTDAYGFVKRRSALQGQGG